MPYDVETHRHVLIAMPDGVRLSANIWKPVGGDGERFPVILEYIPYRKDDWRWASDQARMGTIAARGFVGVRVDIRGTGSSEGVALDEYSPAETDDGVALIAWLAEQPWSNGHIGMWGISYGGFTAIQIAARRPPALKAIAPMYATDDRYSDDVHYFGGAPTASDLAQYAVSQIGMNALPPRPSYAGPGWRDQWRARLEATPPWWPIWLRQQTDGPYWRHGSLAPGYDAIECAVFNIGGWSDGYSSAALRMQSHCQAPSLTVIGNWGHLLPDNAYPGPNVNWLDQMLRFFGYWLRGDDNGVMDEAPLIVFARDYAPPERFPKSWPGHWRAYTPEQLRAQTAHSLWFDGDALTARIVPETTPRALHHDPAWGTCGPLCSGGGTEPNGLAVDLRPDEASALSYTGPEAEADLEVFGWPDVSVRLQVDAPVALLAAWLSDVAPDGTSALITWGALNLTHRRGHTDPQPIPAHAFDVGIRLKPCAYRLAPGHRLRLTLGSTHWPLLWPTAYAHTIQVLGGSLTLPLAMESAPLPAWLSDRIPDQPEIGAYAYSELPGVWRYTEDELARTRTCHLFGGDEQRLPDGTVIRAQEAFEITADRRDPANHRLEQQVEYQLTQDGADIRVHSSGTLRSDQHDFYLALQLKVELDGSLFYERTWSERIPRVLC